MNVRLDIERLVLDGVPVPPESRQALADALRVELTRLIAAHGLGPGALAGGAVPSVAAPSIDAAGSPRRLGAAIAGAVHGGVARWRR